MSAAGHLVKQLTSMRVVRGIVEIHDETWGRSLGILDLLSKSTCCFVAMDGEEEKVLGYCFIEKDDTRGFYELQDIAVSPLNRHRGVGRELVAAAMECCSKIKLMTRVKRHDVVAFFERLGFVAEQCVENYYDIGDDAVRMCWTGR